MADNDVVIIGTGMMSAVGLTAAETAASVRAATSRFTETTWLDKRFEPFMVAEVMEEALPDLVPTFTEEKDLTYRESRMLRLGTEPLLDCVKPISSKTERLGLILALPETETTLPLDRPKFLQRFAKQTEEVFDLNKSSSTPKGRAGGLLAIGQASRMIREGIVKFMIAGGIDTYRDLYVLGTLDMQGRVKSSSNLDGFVPGEGAGFLLLAGRQAAETAGLKPLAIISPVFEGFEEGHLGSEQPYTGDGLAAAVEKMFQESSLNEPVQEVYSSMNGENHWSKEWGVAYLRNQANFNPEHGIHHPADCFGDTGAACGLLLTGLAALGMMQGYRQNPSLVYCSSDQGQRAVLAVSSPQ
ncbi:MAG: beta-ketoacyl synthase N-terminal-like domain-containing protein [Planctomycetota bacterium]